MSRPPARDIKYRWVCTCSHEASGHIRNWGRCLRLDESRRQCKCRRFELPPGEPVEAMDAPGFDWRDMPNPEPKRNPLKLPALLWRSWRLRRRIRRLESEAKRNDGE